MDRIATLSNVEAALSAFERGEIDLATAEERVTAAVRTYATAFDDGDLRAYCVEGTDRTVIVVAESPPAARERATALTDIQPGAIERVGRKE
ncbi:hypothetical protein BRD17_09415 [Halobacteriales archaeon SW_7_68_16]|nr:MAG: hypothetical protein BRD17_09415 [Halobacteriales archaeon SW_7_68_16]